MTTALNQDWVLAEFRRVTKESLNEPEHYTLGQPFGRKETAIWLRIAGNDGWYFPEFTEGRLDRLGYLWPVGEGAWNWMKPEFINPKQQRKIESLFFP